MSGVDEMSCRKGVWKFDTLWKHPLGKGEERQERHAIHHRIVQFDAQKIGREHSTWCEKNLCIVTQLASQYSISLRTRRSMTSCDVIARC